MYVLGLSKRKLFIIKLKLQFIVTSICNLKTIEWWSQLHETEVVESNHILLSLELERFPLCNPQIVTILIAI